MIEHKLGEVDIASYTAPASTAFAFNDVVTLNANGKLAKATKSTPRSELLGLIQKEIAATDADYASDKVVSVLKFNEESEFDAAVGTGTLVQAMVGKRFDLKDENKIDVDSTLQKCVEIVRVISTTKAKVKFITDGNRMRLVSYQQTVTRAEFTDGGGAAGTLDLNVSIPAGAVFLQSLITAITGFVGDTSAVLVIGDGTDVDRYNTGTPSVFATAAAGADMGVPSGTKFHSAAITPKLTVTSNADFTNVSNGAATITLFWLEAD